MEASTKPLYLGFLDKQREWSFHDGLTHYSDYVEAEFSIHGQL